MGPEPSHRAFLLFVLVYVLAMAAVLWAALACTPANAVELDRMSVTLGADDSITVRVPLAVPAGADSAVVVLTLTPGGSQQRTALPMATAVTFRFPAPAEGTTVAFQACGTAWRKGTAGPRSCNRSQTWTRPVTPPGPVTWPDSMTIQGMVWPDSASLALMRLAWADALPRGPLLVVRGSDTLARSEWMTWAGALLVRPAAGCDSTCRWLLTADTFRWSLAARNWLEVRNQAMTFARHPGHRAWWDSVRAAS